MFALRSVNSGDANLRWRAVAMTIAAAIAFGAPTTTQAAPPLGASSGIEANAVCQTVDRVAAANRLSAAFLTRVLWQESRFRSDALSPKGAEGVAQFMPPTALDRGLADPWDPGPAIAAAGRLLAHFRTQFGNIGLAAAAYNAGAGRVQKWLGAATGLPAETRAYVLNVTGWDIQDWVAAGGNRPVLPTDEDCLETVARLPRESAPLRASAASPLDRLLAHALSLAEGQSR
jgi:soluble lytic murein transglycosylase-like protein